MDNLARELGPARPELEYGTIKEAVTPSLVVTTSFGDITAERAASCLVVPEPGDTVLVSVDTSGGAWVLAVLTHAQATPTALEVEGDAVLRVRRGGLTLAPDTDLSCIAVNAAMHADRATVNIGTISLVARVFSSQVERIKRVAGTVDDISREFTRRVTNYFRFTKEHDECQAESRRELVEETLALHSKNTVIVSEEHVKIDGELIHMG